MDKDIRKIMELVQKGILTPEDAEKMINEINLNNSSDIRNSAKKVGNKIGDGIDSVAPKVRYGLKNCFKTVGDFSHKIASKFEDSSTGFSDEQFEEEYGKTVVVEPYVADEKVDEDIVDEIFVEETVVEKEVDGEEIKNMF